MIIKNWSDIQERFEKIKDDKPRASKKLNELGDILSSAYLLDPDAANDMWQYIVDLNVSDDISYSKFYIAQVFNKIRERLKPEEATNFVGMNPERLRLMIMYGYDGDTLWRCLNILIQGYIDSNNPDGALVCIEYYYEKFEGDSKCITAVRVAARTCIECIQNKRNKKIASEILTRIGNSDSEVINEYVQITKAIYGIEDTYDFDALFDSAIENKYPTDFFDLLWAARKECSIEKLRDKWVEYIEDCDDDDIRPWNYIHEDTDKYNKSKLKLYVEIEKTSEPLLDYYFDRRDIYDVEKGIIWAWIDEGNWDYFVKYISKVVMASTEETFVHSSLKRELDVYMMESISNGFLNRWDSYGRSFSKLMDNKSDEFADALSKISAITVGCEAHESFHEFVKNYIQKKYGNLDVLNSVGFNEESDTRTAEKKLKDYIHEFLESGEKVFDRNDIKYTLIMRELRDELHDSQDTKPFSITIDVSNVIAKSLGLDLEEEEEEEPEEITNDLEVEQDYRLALEDEIAEFFFQHFPEARDKRVELLSACIRKRDFSRAVELIDMMAETENNEGYESSNGWGYQNMLTLRFLIEEFAIEEERRWYAKEGITDEMREDVKQLVYRMLPSLPQESQDILKRESIYKIDPNSVDEDEYITQLLEDSIIYTTFPKPRGKGGGKNNNRMTQEFITCFERLSKMGRLDVVIEIMSRFALVSDKMKPIGFTYWVSHMASGLRKGDLIKIFRANKGIFETWLDGEPRDYDIQEVARKMADGCSREEYKEFRNFIISRKGKVRGLDSCFEEIEVDTEPQLFVKANTVEVYFHYLEIENNPHTIAEAIIHLLSEAKTEEVDSIRIQRIEINDIKTDECGFTLDFDEEPVIGYKLNCNYEHSDSLTVYTDFFENNDISDIARIVIQFVIMNDDLEVIEEVSEAVIELDDDMCGFKVVQVAETIKCYVDVEYDESDDEDNNDDDEEDAEEDYDDDDMEEEFEDITIFDNKEISIDFCGVEFDYDDEKLNLSIWCNNRTSEVRKFWISDVMINGDLHESIELIGELVDDCDFCDYLITDYEEEGIEYSDIESLSFKIEIDNENNEELALSRTVLIILDTDEETFNVSVK